MKMDIIESNEQVLDSLTNPMWGAIDSTNENNNAGYKDIRNRHSSFCGKEHFFHINIKFFVMAGLYYIGPYDKVKCAWCNGMMYNWEEGDVPSKEHVKHFPKCEYYVLGKDQSCIQTEFYIDFQSPPIPTVENLKSEINPVLINNQLVSKVHSKIKNSQNCSPSDVIDVIYHLMTEINPPNESNVNAARPNDEPRNCKLCYSDLSNILFLPCRHIISCFKCSQLLSKCPYCKAIIKGKVKVYIP
jgi:hypothetical protein